MTSNQAVKVLSRAFVVACGLGSGIAEAEAKPVKAGHPDQHAGNLVCSDKPVQSGRATYYGTKSDGYAGGKTFSGEKLTFHSMTAASNSFPMGTMLKVVWPDAGRHVIVKVNDTGGFNNPKHLTSKSTVIDLNFGAGKELGMIEAGRIPVVLYKCE